MIDVRRLQVLREVVRQGSFNRAAAELRLTPSAVSQQISALERTLGVAVVRRSTRGVEVTDAGRVLVDTATVVAAELEQARHEIEQLSATGPARLTVATFTSGGQRLLPAAMTLFTAARPDVELTVLESEPDESLALVRTGAADLALAYHFDGPPPVRAGDRSGLAWTPLIDDPMWIVLPQAHPLAGRESVCLADLAGERWVHGCLSMCDTVDHYAALAGFEVQTACRSTDYLFAQSLVRAGLGVSMIPHVALSADPGGLAFVSLRPPAPSRFVGVVTARRRRENPLARAMLDALRETTSVARLARPAPSSA
jgi:DNA-binding transcriptional LysR family regulator